MRKFLQHRPIFLQPLLIELFKQENEVCVPPLALEFMEADAMNGVNGQKGRDSGQRGKLLYRQSLDLAYAQASRLFRSEGMNLIG